MRGPHAALAARLAARDPGREFVLGQRIQYVFLPGTRLQARTLPDHLLNPRERFLRLAWQASCSVQACPIAQLWPCNHLLSLEV